MKKAVHKSILMGMCLFMMVILSACGQKADIEADFDFGYDGVVKISDGNPLKVKVHNIGEGFKGEVQIEIDTDGRNTVLYAKPFEIASSSEKEVTLHVPVYTLQKSFKVSVTKGNKEVYSDEIKAKKFISPEHSVIAVISDQPDDYRFVNTIDLPRTNHDERFNNAYYNSMPRTFNNGSTMVETPALEEDKVKTHILYFDSLTSFNEKVTLDFMDYIYIGETSNLNMTQKVEENITIWMNEGHTLFVETGADYKKTLAQMPSSLINYTITATTEVMIDEIPSGMVVPGEVTIVQGAINKEIGGDYVNVKGIPFGVMTRFGAGKLVTLTMDLGQEPFRGWTGTSHMLSDIFKETNTLIDQTYYEENYYYNNQYRLGRIPMDKAPPYAIMVVVFLFYIALVGPIFYAVFKRLDKRDYLWVAIPAASLVCIVVLYLIGFATRYTKPINNSISTIRYTEGEGYLEVETDIALFNNKKDDVMISWAAEENLEMSSEDRYYGGYRENKELIGKMVLGANKSYTIFNSPLWTPSYMSASKIIPFENTSGKPMIKLNSEGEEISFEITNTTPLDMDYAFMSFGNVFYKIGELKAFETVTVSNGYTGDIYRFFEDELVPNMYDDYSKEGQKRRANVEVLRETLQRQLDQKMNMNQSNAVIGTNVSIHGMNTDAVGYEISINDNDTEEFSRNVISLSGDISYEPGDEIALPHGTLETVMEYDNYGKGQMHAYNHHRIGNVVDMYGMKEGVFVFKVPEVISVDFVELKVDGIYYGRDFHQVYNNNGVNAPVNATFHLKKGDKNEWEEITMDINNLSTFIKIDTDKYMDSDGEIRLKFIMDDSVNTNNDNFNMVLPTIEVKGVVK